MPIFSSTPASSTEPAVGRFDVRVGQPGVQREQRHLDRKGDEEPEKEPYAHAHPGTWPAASAFCRVTKSKVPVFAYSQMIAASMNTEAIMVIQEELHRRIDAPLVAIHADQQRHRDQRGFPEEVEQEKIERDEDADQRRLQHQQQNEEFLHPVVDRPPRDQHAQRHQEGGQQHQPQRDAVDPEVVVDVGSRDPGPLISNWKPARSAVRSVRADAAKAGSATQATTLRANQRISRSRRGNNSSRIAPARGTNVTSVRMMSWLEAFIASPPRSCKR